MNSMQPLPAPPVEIFVDTRGAKIMEDGASNPDQRDSRDIYLPNHIEAVSHIAVDVGGSLAKVVYFTRSRSATSSIPNSPTFQDAPLPSASPDMPSSPQLASRALPNSAGPSRKPSRANMHSRHASASANSQPRTPPPYSSYDHHSSASGTLTPTAILNSPPIASASAIHSTLLKRRSLPSTLPGGRLNFIKFETGDIESCVSFLRELIERSASANNVSIQDMRKGVKLMATGGGAHMFYDMFEQELGVEVHREDEMACLITGLNFITLIPDEVFWYSDELVAALHSPLPTSPEARADAQALRSSIPLQTPLPRPSPNPPLYAPVFDSHPSPKLPCLLVNIGSGVSIIKVDDFGKFERVSGTSLGGGTLWGLLSLLTDAESFDEMLELSEQGDNSTVDMLVGDIYGSVGYNSLGLKSSTIASSFGKVFRKDSKNPNQPKGAEGRKKKFRPEDICKSLLYAISNNIGQIAYMNAEKYNLDRIYFGGCFIRGHQATISTLSYAIRFWSKGTKRAFFLRHEGYLGAIGAWIRHVGFEPPTNAASTGSAAPAESASVPVPAKAPSGMVSSPLASSPLATQTSLANTAANGIPTPIEEAPIGPMAAPPSAAPTPAPRLPSMLAEALGGNSIDGAGASFHPRAPSPLRVQANGIDESTSTDDVRSTQDASVATSNGVVGSEDSEEEMADLQGLMASLSARDRELLGPLLEMGGDQGAGGEGEVSIAELMRRLDAADDAADGIEGRLDELLAKLDGMLESAPVVPS